LALARHGSSIDPSALKRRTTMREQLGTAVGVTIGVLLYDSLRGKLDAGSLYRAAVAFILSFALLTLLAAFKKQKQD
jgi:hypothetical protein